MFSDNDDPQDKPIKPIQKSFEELLEEKLNLDDQPPELEFAKAPDTAESSNSPKPFLRRGSGLARYFFCFQTPKKIISQFSNAMCKSRYLKTCLM